MPRIDIISTDATPEFLNDVGLQILNMWIDFARGAVALGGKRITHPTGRYASAISMRRWGARIGTREKGSTIPQRQLSHIAIIADEHVAPEAAILETGHKGVDMLQHLTPGTFYPIHREGPAPASLGTADSVPRSSYGRRQLRHFWTESRNVGYAGHAGTPTHDFDRGPSNTSGTGPAWYVPPMPAYSPAQHLAEMFANAVGVQITVSD